MKKRYTYIQQIIPERTLRYLSARSGAKKTFLGSLRDIAVIAILIAVTVSSLFAYLYNANAATVLMVPDSDVITGWSTSSGTAHYALVDDGSTDNTADYVQVLNTNTAASVQDQYTLNSPGSVASASQVVLRIWMRATTNANGGTMDTISLNLIVNGTAQTATTCTPVYNSWTACTATYSGSWTQSDVDSMQASIVRNIQGGGNPSSRSDTVQVANVYGTLTYVASSVATQASYRVFNNKDLASKPDITFAETWGGTGGEQTRDSVPTSDGGLFVVGYTTSYGAGGQDALMLKYDASGNIQWSETWGGTSNDFAMSGAQTSDGSYVVTGATASFGDASGDAFLLKLDSSGSLQWSKLWGGSAALDEGEKVIQTSDGGFLVSGVTIAYGTSGSKDAIIIKYDSMGTIKWTSTWGGASSEEAYSVIQTSDGGYAVTGLTQSYGAGGADIILLKFDSSGSLSWSRTWGSATNDAGTSIVQAADGGYVIAGYAAGFGAGGTDAAILKFSSSGTLLWSKVWSGTAVDYFSDMDQTTDGGYVASGYTTSFGMGGNDHLVVKFDSSGSLVWSYLFEGSGNDSGYSISSDTLDNSISVAGYTSSYGSGSDDVLLLKYSSAGTIANCSTICSSVTGGMYSPSATASSSSTVISNPSVTVSSPSSSVNSASGSVSKLALLNTSPIDVGTPMAAQNTAVTAPGDSQPFRLRMNVGISGGILSAGSASYKLQYAPMTTSCDTSFTNTPSSAYRDVTDSTAVRYYDNPIALNGLSLVSNASDPTDGSSPILQSYQEKGATNFTNPSDISSGSYGMWDFALTTYHTTQNTSYCLRIVNSSGLPLSIYSNIPQINIPASSFTQDGYRWFNNNTSTTGQRTTDVTRTDYPVGGTYPDSVVTADVNNDGSKDIITVNNSTNNISVLKNNGSGAFATSDTYNTGTSPYTATTGDFDKDGYVDIAVVNYSSGTVSVFINKKDGTFANGVSYNAGANPVDIEAGDLNADGYPDLVVVNYGSNVISILNNNGNGTFASPTTKAVGTSPWNVGIADLNNDGWKDIVVANRASQNFSVLMNNAGTIANQVTYTAQAYPNYILMSDLNGDGYLDVVTPNYNVNTVSVFLNNKDGTFAPQVTFNTGTGTNPWSVSALDVNGDGAQDLAVLYRTTNTVAVFTNDGSGTFTLATTYPVGVLPLDSTVDDVNGDGYTDIITANATDNTISVLINNSSPPINVGSPLAGDSKVANLRSAGLPLRLRVNLTTSVSGVGSGSQGFKLQYALRSTTCQVASYSDVTASTPIRWYDNSTLSSATVIGANAGDPSGGSVAIAPQTYQESNPFTTTSKMYVGQGGMWDFSLIVPTGTLPGKSFCMRVVKSDGSALDNYSRIAELQFGPIMSQMTRTGGWFDQNGTRQPYFTGR